MPKKKALKIMAKSIESYSKKLNNNDFIIFYYENKNLLCKQVKFLDTNFLHLTGVSTKLKAQNFYDYLASGKLSERDFDLKYNGTTMQKLEVLEKLHSPFYSPAMIGQFDNHLKLNLVCDSAIGDEKRPPLTLGIDISKKENNNFYFPKTLLKESIKQNSNPIFPIKIIFKKSNKDFHYSEVSFISKSIDLIEFFKNHKKELLNKQICPNFIEKTLG